MVVYIEYVILDNFIIDLLLLWGTTKILKQKIIKFRLIFGALLGTVFAVFSPFFPIYGVWQIILKFFIGLAIMFIGIAPQKIKTLFLSFVIFLSLTFVAGGVCFGLAGMLGEFIFGANFAAYSQDFPISIILVGLVALLYFSITIYNYFMHSKSKLQNIVSLEIKHGQFSYKTQGFIDTGNQLFDKINGKPISIFSTKSFLKMFDNKYTEIDIINAKLSHNTQFAKEFSHTELIHIDTVSKIKNKHLTVVLDQLTISHQNKTIVQKEVIIALSNFETNKQQFDLILNPNILL